MRRIYVLKSFATGLKAYDEEMDIGYFTNKAALRKAIIEKQKQLGIKDLRSALKALDHNDLNRLNLLMITGELLNPKANKWFIEFCETD